MIKLNENDYKNIIENCIRRLITEEMYDDNEEMTPFEKYAQDLASIKEPIRKDKIWIGMNLLNGV